MIRHLERATELLSDVAMAARLARDAPSFLRRPLSADQVLARTRAQMATREARFLEMVDRTIFGTKRGPYRALLQHAGCDPGDLRALVEAEGLEGALGRLARAGVYVTFDELKGRRPIERGSLRLSVRPRDFDNPVFAPHMLMLTSGSGGRPGRVVRSLALVENLGVVYRLHALVRRIHTPDFVMWWPFAPPLMLSVARAGMSMSSWHYPVHPLPRLARLGAWYFWAIGRLGGQRFPSPRRADLDSPAIVLEEMLGLVADGRQPILYTMPSAAARLAVEARRQGRRLDGLVIAAIGEPMTMARKAMIVDSGARLLMMYGAVETPSIGGSCESSAPDKATDDMHVLTCRYALTHHRREMAMGRETVDALLVTALDACSAKIALNAETGDHAQIQERACGCLLDELGMRTHVCNIRSFEKLTSEGVTFARSRLEEIVEHELPARFGGMAIDYQLAEEEASNSATRLVLRVDPSVGAIDEDAIRTVLLRELASEGIAAAYSAAIWRDAGTVEVRREPPRATRAGKVLPLQVLGRG
jgi:hypothetical protein